jgi:hypothetical protein
LQPLVLRLLFVRNAFEKRTLDLPTDRAGLKSVSTSACAEKRGAGRPGRS